MRHTYVTLGRLSGLNDFEIQTLARQKSAGVRERYSHGRQAIDYVEARRKLEAPVKSKIEMFRQVTGNAKSMETRGGIA
jgi:hypothetical protein